MVSDRDNSSMSERVRKVVCIEDEQEMIELVRLILSRQNIEVVGALGGPEGLERIAEERPDLVLLDLMMPEMDGWEVYQKMKSSEEMRRIPVIVVTAKAQSIDRVLGLHIARVDDYITKPFGPQELLESVQRVMEKNEQVASDGGESERG
jgi:two-component system, OmpR family, response regulator VicR